MMMLGSLSVSHSNCSTSLTILTLSLASFDVYIRRAYKAYTLLSVDYEEGDGLDDGEAPHVATWRFKLGQEFAAPVTPSLYVSYPFPSRSNKLMINELQG